VVERHLQHVKDDADHYNVLEFLALDHFPHIEAPALLWFVAQLVGRLGLHDEPLELEPVELLLVEASLFLLLRLLILQEEHANEEVEEEEAADEDEDDEEEHLAFAVLVLGPVVLLCDIDRLVHDVGPALQR